MPFDLQHPVRAIEADGYTGGEVSLRRYAGRCATGEVQDGLQIPRTSPFHITLSVAEAAEKNCRVAKYGSVEFRVGATMPSTTGFFPSPRGRGLG